jgi:phage minor structural protein
MYTIYSDNNLIYAPNLADEVDGGYSVISPVVVSELNAAGSAEFKLPTCNPSYDAIRKMKSIVKIYDERQTETGVSRRRIFRGRVLNDEIDLLNRKDVYAEGALAFFNDSLVRPYSFTGSVSEYFAFLINQHNSQVDSEKQFIVGNCTVTDPNNYIVRESSDYTSTMQEIKDKLLDLLGGYITPRYEVVNGQEVEYIDYLAVSGGQSTQDIVFSENLLDINSLIDATDVYTIIVPLGKSDPNTGKRLTIVSVNDGKDYLESAVGIAIYGRITKSKEYDDITLAQNLKTRGEQELTSGILSSMTINLSAFDLHLLNVDTDALEVGKYNHVISVPHNITSQFQCRKTKVNLSDPGNSEYTFGAASATLTGTSAKSSQAGAAALHAAKVANVAADATANALNIALEEVAQGYVTKTSYLELEARVAALEGSNG